MSQQYELAESSGLAYDDGPVAVEHADEDRGAAFDTSSMAVGCTVTLNGVLWRFGADAQPSSYLPNEVSVSCP